MTASMQTKVSIAAIQNTALPTSIGVGLEDGELEDIENVEQYDYDERYAQQP
jgi:hypothetical protein